MRARIHPFVTPEGFMKPVKRFLVLGIGDAQMDLLRHLHQFDDIVIHALSNTDIGRGRSLVRKFEKIDITDKEAVLAYSRRHGIDLIYTIGSDVAMPTVSWVSEQLGLKTFISSETAYLCNNKHLFRQRLENVYGSVPYELLDESLTLDKVSFPAIVKPVDSQGQRGITELADERGLREAYEKAISFSRKGEAIIEEKIEGPEVSVHAYAKEGKILFFLPSDRISWKGYDGGIIHKHVLPASISRKAEENLQRLVSEVSEALDIRNGPIYFQIKMREEEPFLIEVTPRLDGCHMWRQIHKSTGIDLLETTIRHLMDRPFSIPENFKIKPSTLEFLCQAPGGPFTKRKISDDACYYEFYYRAGDTVRSVNGQLEKCGYQLIVNDPHG